MMKLSEANIGSRCKIIKIDVDKYVKTRLEIIGLTEGVTVKLVRRAPLGDPIEINLRGFYLAIRNSDADKIQVESL